MDWVKQADTLVRQDNSVIVDLGCDAMYAYAYCVPLCVFCARCVLLWMSEVTVC